MIKKEKSIVVARQKSKEKKPIKDPAWIAAIVQQYPKYLTFHSLIREIYKIESRKDISDRRARAVSVVSAAKKVLPHDVQTSVANDIGQDGELEYTLDIDDDSREYADTNPFTNVLEGIE